MAGASSGRACAVILKIETVDEPEAMHVEDEGDNEEDCAEKMNVDSHPNSKGSPKQQLKHKCPHCSKFFATKGALWRHNLNFHSTSGSTKVVCRYCGNAYRRHSLPIHEQNCSTKSGLRRRQDCSFEDCSASFYKKEQLIEHMKELHMFPLEPVRTFKFETLEDFKTWKEEEEDRTFSFYSKHAGTKKNTNTYYCQLEGSERPHRSSSDTKDIVRHNKKGRVKSGRACTSFIRARFEPNGVTVNYWPTHNHPLSRDDVKHHPLSEATLNFIKEQIKLNIPSRQIQAAVKKRLAESQDARVRDSHVTLKRITSMARRMRRTSQLPNIPNDAVELFNAYVEVLLALEDSPVLLYQPPSETSHLESPNEEDHLFFVAVQTSDQQKMLQRDTAMPMFISVTKADYTFQYYLISIVVPCERNFEYPVGHLITSQMNEEVISLFLQSIGERCPELNVNCVVSVDNPEIISAINRVFGSDGPYFLSKWHFLEFVQNNLLGAVPSNKVEELFDFVLAMSDAKTEDRFLFLYNSFKEQYESDFPDVLSAFAEFFVRGASWASCYRQYPGIIDSCLYVDAFQSKLNKKYRRRPTKNINLILELVLQMQEEYRDTRENKQSLSQSEERIKEQHKMASEIPSELVQETLLHHWTVQASKHGQAFCVMQCVSKCSEEECTLKCKDCGNLCSHLFFCTCGKNGTICLHVHKVFMEHGSSLDAEHQVEEASFPGIEEDEGLCDEGLDNCGFTVLEENEKTAEVTNENDELKLEILNDLDFLQQSVSQGHYSGEMLGAIRETLKSILQECENVSGRS